MIIYQFAYIIDKKAKDQRDDITAQGHPVLWDTETILHHKISLCNHRISKSKWMSEVRGQFPLLYMHSSAISGNELFSINVII